MHTYIPKYELHQRDWNAPRPATGPLIEVSCPHGTLLHAPGVDGGGRFALDRPLHEYLDRPIPDYDNQAKLWSGIVRGDGLSPRRRDDLVKPQLPIRSTYQFPTLYTEADPRPPRIDLAAGLGVATYGSVSGKTWFKGGHDRRTGNMLVCREAVKRCVVLLANSVRAELINPEMVEFVLGDVGMPWWWEYHLD